MSRIEDRSGFQGFRRVFARLSSFERTGNVL